MPDHDKWPSSNDWLGRAQHAFMTKNRAHYQNADGQTVNNMDEVIFCLQQILKDDVFRLSAHFGIATAYLFKRAPKEALQKYREIREITGGHSLALFHIYIWTTLLDDEKKEMARKELLNNAPDLGRYAEYILGQLAGWQSVYSEHICLSQPAIIVIQGLKLDEHGNKTPELINRLKSGLAVWETNKQSKIVVTGGLPVNGKTEAHEMAQWLLSAGVPSHLIIKESWAKNTVDNALFSAEIIAQIPLSTVCVVSCNQHLPRSTVLLNIALYKQGITNRQVLTTGTNNQNDMNPDLSEKVSILCDAVRVLGFPAFDIGHMYFR
ncbi:YdcF family protein [Veronia pacifica]|uniref:DUF218 domain-containing protein n=1 Tax=Veronia pacifica TaxID=1080227 RepID=A0A1C3EKL9_9GAMM|nr:YdcF family protein [Veronia pacifica]ODA33787.1 hypothetical protein A8L45_09160 [Veronia pacifica]